MFNFPITSSQYKRTAILLVLICLSTYGRLYGQSIFCFEADSTYRSGLEISMGKNNVTGIFIMRLENGLCVGSIINEFGIKALDFSYQINRRKVKLQNVVAILDRWAVRQILKRDFKNLLMADGKIHSKNYNLRIAGHEIAFINTRHNITYHFFPLDETTE